MAGVEEVEEGMEAATQPKDDRRQIGTERPE